MTSSGKHSDTIREQFTATADVFAENVRTLRAKQAERLAECVTQGFSGTSDALAIDVACGPGTFTRPLARRVRRAIGVDLTPAMIEKARAEAKRENIDNIEFICSDVGALPFPDGAAGIVSCGYAVHHMLEPARALAEMVRALRPGGRVVINDIVVEEGCDAILQNNIERLRDPSHTTTLSLAEFRKLFHDAGLRIITEEVLDFWHDFDTWMQNAGSVPGDKLYVRVRGMMEQSLAHDTSGFRPRQSERPGELDFMHKVLLIVGEKQ
jgi:ubiquinone/menaquinone biosynthesis C-methylase UbiE